MAKERLELRELLRTLELRFGYADDSIKACCGITLAQCHALVEIGRDEGIPPTVLAEALELDKGNVSKTVGALVRLGLVRKVSDDLSRRSVNLLLTDRGRTMYRSIERDMDTFYRKIQELLPADRLDQIHESLRLLCAAFQTLRLQEYEAACGCTEEET
ncbi:MAG: MarR family transcriptional regulator [Clostridia bacterium]|nr:MarR family transcriptional regulator [Clostridia bacterium]